MSEFLVCRTVYQPPPERITDPGIPQHCISLHIANPGNRERLLDRRLDREKRLSRPTSPGTFTFVSALRESEWFWESEVEIVDLYVPSARLEQVAIEMSDACRPVELIDRFGDRDPLLEQLVLTLAAETERNGTMNRLYRASIENLIAVHLLQHHCSTPLPDLPLEAPSEGLPKAKLRLVLDYIQAHLDRDLRLTELAEVVQLSSHHFGKLFKQSMGMSPHQYVVQCRVDRSQQLLANYQLSLAEIAQSVGFCDQSHFTNTFHRQTGLTPTQYRYGL